MDEFTSFISGYIRLSLNKFAPLDIVCVISAYSAGKHGTLLIKQNETKTLQSDKRYEFTSVVIESNAILTVNEWVNSKVGTGGRLLIEAMTYFIIKKGGKIQLDSKGYKGGTGNGWSGGTYQSEKPAYHRSNRPGGGGGGGWTAYGGGGGYGTPGTTSTFASQEGDNGGQTYGDETFSSGCIHLGSGGGSCTESGGNGGGALKVECVKFANYGQISVNGGRPKCVNDGGGSGGSVFIVCQEFIMDGKDQESNFIHAYGGKNLFEPDATGKGGDGGDGRIMIKCETNKSLIMECVTNEQIQPSPYIA